MEQRTMQRLRAAREEVPVNEHTPVFEQIRSHPATPSVAMALALAGQLSLYVDRGLPVGMKDADGPGQLQVDEVRDIMRAGKEELSSLNMEVGEGNITLTGPANELDPTAEYSEVFVPGVTTEDSFNIPMSFAGYRYDNAPEPTTPEAEMEAAVRAGVEASIVEFAALGVDANSAVAAIELVVEGYASAEGPSDANEYASTVRAEKVAAIARDVLTTAGIDESKINVTTEGQGEEGTLNEFVEVLEAKGFPVDGKTVAEKEQAVVSVVDACNKGREKRPAVLKAFEETVASHRRAAVQMTTQRADVTYRFAQPVQQLFDTLDHAVPQSPEKEQQLPVGEDILLTALAKAAAGKSIPVNQLRAPREIAPRVTRRRGNKQLVLTTGTSTGTSIPRAHSSSGAYERGTGRNIKNGKRSSNSGKSRRNGSRG